MMLRSRGRYLLPVALLPLLTPITASATTAAPIVRATYENGQANSGYPGIGLAGCCTYSLNVDNNLPRTGLYSLRSQVRYGDAQVAGGPRAESDTLRITTARFQPGQTFWYGLSVYIPSTWPDDLASEDIIHQWHYTKSSCDNPARGPAMFLEVIPPTSVYPSRLRLRVNSDPVLCDYRDNAEANLKKVSYDLATLTKGVWHDFVFHVNWQYTNTGFIRAWHQTSKLPGWNQVLSAERVANAYNSPTAFGYLKWGLYKPAWRNGPTAVTQRVVWHDNIAVAPDSATGFQDVDPSA
jgi:hypothetical protein